MGKLRIINPTTEDVFGVLDESSFFEIENRVLKAKEDKRWSEINIEERVKIVEKLVGLLERNKEEIAIIMAQEIGKPLKAGRHEIELSEKRIKAFCQQIPEFIKDEILYEDDNEKNLVKYESLGVAAVISPWNAPVFVSLASIIPALLCGNNIIWKPSEYSSFTGLKIVTLFEELKKEGLPENAFQFVIGGKEVGKKLVESDVNLIVLTGSVKAGQEVIKNSAEKMHRFVLELGGKDPAIILDDANLEIAAKEIVKSGTMYTGQICFGVERVYCLPGIYDKFIEKCVEEIKKIKVGNPLSEETDMGPFSVKFQMEKVVEQIRDALIRGAKLIYGGERLGERGYFISPGIMINVNHKMKIMKEETFGPMIPVMKVSSIEEAITLANDSEYGLTASIWTSDIKKGEEIALKIEAGTLEINRHGMSKPGCPWGGYKMSGFGRIYSRDGTRNLTNVKHIWVVKK